MSAFAKKRPTKLRKKRTMLDSTGKFQIATSGTVWDDGRVTVHFDGLQDGPAINPKFIPVATPGSLLDYVIRSL